MKNEDIKFIRTREGKICKVLDINDFVITYLIYNIKIHTINKRFDILTHKRHKYDIVEEITYEKYPEYYL